jgi:endonuclease/exonuclease/phosphatase (EEP) superfamily protein YafD
VVVLHDQSRKNTSTEIPHTIFIGPPRGLRSVPIMRGRWVTAAGWVVVTPVILWTAVRLTGLERGPFVQLMAFTPYVVALSIVPLALVIALRRWAVTIVAAVATVLLAAVVAPRAIADDAERGGPELRVLTVNVLGGGADPARVVALVRAHGVDVLSVQELQPEVVAGLDVAGLGDLLPYRAAEGVDAGLFARLPLDDVGRRYLPGGFEQAHATVRVPGAAPVVVEAVHNCSPYSFSQLKCWFADLAAQPAATPDGSPRILAGDFNATLDHRPLRDLLATGYVDAADRAGVGLTGTWGPYDGDRIPPVVIDHVLVDRRIAVRAASVHPVAGSDHRAVLAVVSLPAG